MTEVCPSCSGDSGIEEVIEDCDAAEGGAELMSFAQPCKSCGIYLGGNRIRGCSYHLVKIEVYKK